jgi:hypothetical protein
LDYHTKGELIEKQHKKNSIFIGKKDMFYVMKNLKYQDDFKLSIKDNKKQEEIIFVEKK